MNETNVFGRSDAAKNEFSETGIVLILEIGHPGSDPSAVLAVSGIFYLVEYTLFDAFGNVRRIGIGNENRRVMAAQCFVEQNHRLFPDFVQVPILPARIWIRLWWFTSNQANRKFMLVYLKLSVDYTTGLRGHSISEIAKLTNSLHYQPFRVLHFLVPSSSHAHRDQLHSQLSVKYQKHWDS